MPDAIDKVSRREILRWAPSGAGVALLPAEAAAQSNASRPARPNIILVISDQFRADNLGCMGLNPMNLTPNLDAMARGGVLFRSAICNQPVCAPARATIFTGQYPEKHGVWRNGPALRPDTVTLAGLLRNEGYTANYIGKWHLAPNGGTISPGPVAPQQRGGFLDHWEGSNLLEFTSHGFEGELYDNDGRPIRFNDTYRTDFMTDRAVRFLRNPGTKPFLLVLSYLETHHQNDIDRFVPPRKYENQFRDFFVPQDLRPLAGSWPHQLADYYGCVAGIDDAMGTILGTLKQQGLEDNTIVVFTSDHSCHFKTRNTEYKRSPHESSIHIPLIIRGPGFRGPAQIQELVSQVDLSPTLLAAVGAAIPSSMQGRSFLPLVKGENPEWRNEVYFRMSEFVTGRAIRTPQYTYAVSAPKRPGWQPVAESDSFVEYILYDLFADPFQHTNLAGHADSRIVEEKMRGRLLARIAEAGGLHPTIEPCWFPYS